MIQIDQAPLQTLKITPMGKNDTIWGFLIALAIIGIWAVSLFFFLSLDISIHVMLLPVILWQTFLYTGLFITAHDAMHGAVFPQNHKLNNFVGSVALFFYALFPYKKLLKKHGLHHNHPASEIDPDFHDGKKQKLFGLVFSFYEGVLELDTNYRINGYI